MQEIKRYTKSENRQMRADLIEDLNRCEMFHRIDWKSETDDDRKKCCCLMSDRLQTVYGYLNSDIALEIETTMLAWVVVRHLYLAANLVSQREWDRDINLNIMNWRKVKDKKATLRLKRRYRDKDAYGKISEWYRNRPNFVLVD